MTLAVVNNVLAILDNFSAMFDDILAVFDDILPVFDDVLAVFDVVWLDYFEASFVSSCKYYFRMTSKFLRKTDSRAAVGVICSGTNPQVKESTWEAKGDILGG